ncbi:MAG: hypothetical protein QGI89_00695 [Candidatus Woesearchaeota archaeon]|jgi:hypothetical protein|nr:hypothetical protein [Candidatus Woesearchaeota archaeon]MDP7322836.1 hypothetical protein [Candidatus Woesearchaeota archaeon]HJO02252.1 hypothetical protein [Candidatus Woesearchaeota archaeon]|tara:strand:- start:38 stop:376 length:339 start_codon:yes stop_codon:yes gene_type:complete
MQNISLDHTDIANLKNFFRKLCLVSTRYTKKDKSTETATKEMLKIRVLELEEEVHKAKEERDKALEENKNKINQLNGALISVKIKMNELLQAKKEKEIRTRNLERKIRKTVK